MCSCFPTAVHTGLHASAVFAATLADALWLWGFSNRVYHVVKITVGENTLDPGSLTQQTWCFGPNIVARDSKMLIMTLSIDSYRGLVVSFSCSVCVESTVSVDSYRGLVVCFLCSVCVESTVSVDSYRGLVVRFSCSVCVESTMSVDSYRGLVVSFSCSVCFESTTVMYMSWPAKIKWEKMYQGYIWQSWIVSWSWTEISTVTR